MSNLCGFNCQTAQKLRRESWEHVPATVEIAFVPTARVGAGLAHVLDMFLQPFPGSRPAFSLPCRFFLAQDQPFPSPAGVAGPNIQNHVVDQTLEAWQACE